MPRRGARGRPSGLVVALAVALVVAVTAVVVLSVMLGRGDDRGASTSTVAGHSIDMRAATSVNCPEPIPPGPGHPSVVLSQLFRVQDTGHTPYLLGWEIVPYRATTRVYRFGATGSILALEPAAGGKPLGYGRGTVTFAGGTREGTVDAVITVAAGGSLEVSGKWTCTTGARSTG